MRSMVVVGLLGVLPAAVLTQRAPEVLRPVDALPAQLVNRLDDVTGIVSLSDGRSLLLDRRAHTVFMLAPGQRNLRRLFEIGREPGNLISPQAIAISRDDIFAVLDSPDGLPRIQYFTGDGLRLGGFLLPMPDSPTPRLTGGLSISSVGAFAFTGKTFLVSEPSWGSLFMEVDTTGEVLRHIGQWRLTGHEAERDVHMALNLGLPVVDPTGGFYFVFQTGVPALRKYDSSGQLIFERHIEGPELDGLIQALPTTWAARSGSTRPLAPTLVRTAMADSLGNLWISLRSGVTYVYDRSGEKVRTVRFQAAGVLSPDYFFFRGTRLLVTPGGYMFDTN